MGEINTAPLAMDKLARQKLNTEILELTGVINQMDLTYLQNIYFTPKHKTSPFSQYLIELSSKIDHILRHKASLNRYKKIEIIDSTLSDHQGLNRDTNNRINTKLTNA